jgi:CelD/BcsL family acetyltransferase involved in cellulose biosynthesis
MRTRLLALSDVNSDVWAGKALLRDAGAHYDNPLFDSEIVRAAGTVRNDVRVLIAEDCHGLAAVWPLHLRPGGWTRPIAGPFSDWHGPVLRDGSTLQPRELLAQAGVNGMTVHGLARVSSDALALQLDEAYLTDLSGGYDTLIAAQSLIHPSFFKKLRRLERKLLREFPDTIFTYDDTDPAALDWLLHEKRRQFTQTGRHDVLASDWARAYVARLRHARAERFGSVVSTLRVNGTVVAAEFNLHSDRVMHGWLAAFAPDFAAYSPGHILVRHILEAIPAKGLQVYDAGTGFGHYKKYFSNLSAPSGSGVLNGRQTLDPARLMASVWRMAESQAPARLRSVLARARRRMDQIAMSETGWQARVGGIIEAVDGARAAGRLAARGQDR